MTTKAASKSWGTSLAADVVERQTSRRDSVSREQAQAAALQEAVQDGALPLMAAIHAATKTAVDVLHERVGRERFRVFDVDTPLERSVSIRMVGPEDTWVRVAAEVVETDPMPGLRVVTNKWGGLSAFYRFIVADDRLALDLAGETLDTAEAISNRVFGPWVQRVLERSL